jgi:hypothetical protein
MAVAKSLTDFRPDLHQLAGYTTPAHSPGFGWRRRPETLRDPFADLNSDAARIDQPGDQISWAPTREKLCLVTSIPLFVRAAARSSAI